MTLSEIRTETKTEAPKNGLPDRTIHALITDSRKVIDPSDALFVALKGPNRDGHLFIKDAYEKGIRAFLISEPVDRHLFPEAAFIKVKNTLDTLQQLAVTHRQKFHFPVIGITGSNGKTIVKEWLFQLLAPDYNIVRNPKSYNSQIGVPLSVWRMAPANDLGIFEAGISQPGEMENLEKMILPDIGIFTNIGDAHSEGFLNTTQKIREKLLLFRHARMIIYCKDYHDLNENVVAYRSQIRNDEEDDINLFTWSQKTEATLRVTNVTTEGRTSIIEGVYEGQSLQISIPFSDHASIENAIHCWCVLLYLKISPSEVQQRMKGLHSVAMRLELIHGINNCTLINDSYNSDLNSLQIALDFLMQQKQHPRKTIILSDMLQISKPDSELYEEVAAWMMQKNIHRMIGIGPVISRNKAAFRKYKNIRSIFFKTTADFLKKIHLMTFENEVILLKGARIFRFEKIEKLLEQKIHSTVLEINLSAVEHNLNTYRTILPGDVKIMVMVKAFSYGSGSYEIANLLQYSGVDYLAVAYVDEGVNLRKAGITMPIMVMSPEAGAFDRMISWKLEPEIFSLLALREFVSIAKVLGKEHYPVHIKLDTGMHRLGFMESEMDALVSTLTHNQYIKVASIFSHLAGSDEAAFDSFTRSQAAQFEKMTNRLLPVLPGKPLLHLLNSSGITRHTRLHYDMVRLGIGLYGVDNSHKVQSKLRPVGELKTTIAQIKTLDAGETVGYGRKGALARPAMIATVSIGYADGYFRDFGNGRAYMLVHGQKAPVIGSVCMDMCMLDVTDIENVSVGDEAIVFGKELPVSRLAEWAHTIPYEVMTGISQRVNRVYLNE